MTNRVKALLMGALVLAACGGNPFEGTAVVTPPAGGVTPDPTDPTAAVVIPASVRQGLTGSGLATYEVNAPTITINLSSQDANALEAVYQRAPQFDVENYHGYAYQETTSNRYVVVLVRETGSASGVIAMDAGQFSTFHSGGGYSRADVFTRPETGVGQRFDYSGTYVGLLNSGVPAPGGPGGIFNPEIADRTRGTALITADFTNMTMSGGVNGRTNLGTGESLSDITLYDTTIAANGTFEGRVQRLDPGTATTPGSFTDAGVYAGLFAGTNAADIATLMVFNPLRGQSLLFENGMVVLSNCATGGGPACP